jgi:hypothetical protein
MEASLKKEKAMGLKQSINQHHHGSDLHDHPVPPAKPKFSSQEKLIIRLERFLQHNFEHADMLSRWADEVERWGDLPTAKLIHTAETSSYTLNKPLEKAIARLKKETRATDSKRSRPRIPKNPLASDSPRPKAAYTEKR